MTKEKVEGTDLSGEAAPVCGCDTESCGRKLVAAGLVLAVVAVLAAVFCRCGEKGKE